MTDKDEWGPWVEHDGKGCPVPIGAWIRVRCRNRDGTEIEKEGRLSKEARDCPSWVMKDHKGAWNQVIRYRIRKPRGMAVLESILSDIPEEVEA